VLTIPPDAPRSISTHPERTAPSRHHVLGGGTCTVSQPSFHCQPHLGCFLFIPPPSYVFSLSTMVVSTLLVRATVVATTVTLAATFSAAEPFGPIGTCDALTYFNLFALRDLHMTGAEVLGPLAVGGDARLDGFSINSEGACGTHSAALAVAGSLKAANGQVAAGSVVVSGRSHIASSVGLRCAKVIDGDVHLGALAKAAVDGHERMCGRPVTGCKTTLGHDGVVTLRVVRGRSAVCAVHVRVLRNAKRVAIVGRSEHQVVIIQAVSDGATTLALSNVGFHGFVPSRTVLAVCGRVGSLIIDNVGLPAALSAPETDLSGPAGHVLGTVIVRSVRGGVEFRHDPFDCDVGEEKPRPSPEADY